MAPSTAPAPAPALNPGARPRRGLAVALAGIAAVGVLTVAAVVGTSPEPAAAAGLETFSSCAELEAWASDAASTAAGGDVASFEGGPATTAVFDTVGAEISSDGAAPVATGDRASTEASTATGAPGADDGGTNVAVEGVDELDLVDRIDDRRALFASSTAVVLVDLQGGERLARVAVPYGAQISHDPDTGIVWVVSSTDDGMGTAVRRVAVDGDELRDQGTWSTSGWLVTARRVGDLLHLVVTEGLPGVAGPTPFAGGPVPCDQVLHPAGPSDPSATLIATLPAGGELAPLRATEVVGSGSLVHVTTEAAYLATPQWEDQVTTTIHRFELDDLEHTGSGRVPGTLLDDLSMSDDGEHLRVAVTAGGGRFAPIAIEDGIGDVAVASDGGGSQVSGEPGAPVPAPSETVVAEAPPSIPTTAPVETTVPETTIPGEPTTTVTTTVTTEPTTSTTVAPTTTTEAPTTTVAETTTTTGAPVEQPGPNDPLNRILVLDTEGDLDVVGRTPWFGKPGETLHGVRFDGPTAYAVTFLQTDPFYVVDLSEPADPRIAGEVELPGFSSYLHPMGDGTVVGFGPDADGMASAKLFDVSDPTAPRVVDSIALGGDAPVAYDRHAFTDLGDGRFATPVTRWEPVVGAPCVVPEGAPEGPAVDPVCAPSAVTNEVVELEVDGGRLREVGRVEVQLAEPASRVLPVGDGWAVLAGTTVALVDADGGLRTSVDLS